MKDKKKSKDKDKKKSKKKSKDKSKKKKRIEFISEPVVEEKHESLFTRLRNRYQTWLRT